MSGISGPLHIGIIGSGAAAVGALRALSQLKLNVKITLFDIGKTEPDPEFENYSVDGIKQFYADNYRQIKQRFGYIFPPLKTQFSESLPQYKVNGTARFFRSELFGGLTNYWGGTTLPFESMDFSAWPINKSDLDPYYDDIAQLVGISGMQDGLSRCYSTEYYNRPPIHIMKGMQCLCDLVNSRQALGNHDIYAGVNRVALETRDGLANTCVYCGECMAGCVLGSIYSAKNTIARYIKEMDIDYVTGKVLRISSQGSSVVLNTSEGQREITGFDKVFLCAGCIGTTEIVMRSLGVKESLRLIDNAVFQFPVVNLGFGQSDRDKDRYQSLSSLIFACVPRDGGSLPAQVQLYPNFDYMWRLCIPEFLWPAVSRAVSFSRDRLIWARMYLDGSQSFHYAVSLGQNDTLAFEGIQKPSFKAAKELMSCIKSVVNHDGFYVLPVRPLLSKSSSHLAGTLPYGGDVVPVKSNGEVMPNTYICDSACFPESPATSPTFTIMANASRTVAEALS